MPQGLAPNFNRGLVFAPFQIQIAQIAMAPDMTRLQMDRAKISLERLIRSRAIPVQIAQIVVCFGQRLIQRQSPQIDYLRSTEIALPPPQDT